MTIGQSIFTASKNISFQSHLVDHLTFEDQKQNRVKDIYFQSCQFISKMVIFCIFLYLVSIVSKPKPIRKTNLLQW